MSNDDWQSQKFRQNVISKINEMLQANGQDPSKNAGVMENHIFKKSRTKDEYLGLVAKLFVHFKELGRAKQQPPPQNPEMNHQGMMQDPLNALQNLASQGNRNPQMMSMSSGPNSNQMGGPVPASNLLQTLNQHRPGQQQIQQMHTIRGQMAMNAGGPGNQMVNQINNMQMMAGNAGAGGPVAQSMGGMPGQMNAGGVAGGPQVVGPGLPNAVSNQIHLQNSGPMNVNNMNVQQMQQMNQNQMMNMNHPQLSQMMNARLNQANAGPGGNAVGGNMQQNQNGGPGAMHPNGPSVAGAGNAQVAQAGNLSQMLNMPHKANMQGAGGGQMFAGNRAVAGQQQFLRQSASPVNSQQQQQQLQQQLQQQVQQQQQQQAPQQVQQQSQPRSQTPQQGPGTPQQQQQPQQSPVQQQQQAPQAQQNQAAQQQAAQAQQSSNSQMIPSPAMGPTPSPQMPSQHIMQGNQRNMSHPSPGGPANNAGGGQMNANSPFNPNEEHLYREKYKQLTKYIEPLKHMLDRDRTNSDKMAKMNKLLEILSNPTHRVPLETLLKCEKALEKMELSQIIDTRPSPASGPSSAAGAAQSPAQVPSPAQPTSAAATAAMSTIAIGKSANPLLEVVTTTMQSPLANHTLYRTFRPALDVLFGSDIVAPKKLRTTPPPDEAETNELKVPYALQGEVARLDTKFKVKLDQSVKHDTKSIRLNCSLDDKRLPSVPPVQINISEEYPMVSPGFSMPTNDYGVTPFLKKVQSALMARITKLPKRHSLTHLLDCWEMSVRQACSPDAKPAFFDLSAIYVV